MVSETFMTMLIVLDLALLSISLLNTGIMVVGLQGILLGLFVISSHVNALSVRLVIIACVGIAIKGFVFPLLLRRAVKEAGIQREIRPFVGASLSLLIGVAMLFAALWIGSKISLKGIIDVPFAVPASFMTMFTGLFLVIARKTALTQCIGYIVFENGIYAFGVAAVGQTPLLVELGLLLDAFVGVFVMGIAIYHINHEFDSMDATELSSLKG
jgi:hydrogenase-4 component E